MESKTKSEEETVARAISPSEWDGMEAFGKAAADTIKRKELLLQNARKIIFALDQYRAKNAGEVERECAEIIDRNKMYMDGFDGKNELVVGPLNLRWRVEEATDQLSKAANLISSMRAVIEEKDRALRPFVDYLNAIDPQDFASDESEIGIEIIGPFRRAIKFRDLRLTRSTISDGVK